MLENGVTCKSSNPEATVAKFLNHGSKSTFPCCVLFCCTSSSLGCFDSVFLFAQCALSVARRRRAPPARRGPRWGPRWGAHFSKTNVLPKTNFARPDEGTTSSLISSLNPLLIEYSSIFTLLYLAPGLFIKLS